MPGVTFARGFGTTSSVILDIPGSGRMKNDRRGPSSAWSAAPRRKRDRTLTIPPRGTATNNLDDGTSDPARFVFAILKISGRGRMQLTWGRFLILGPAWGDRYEYHRSLCFFKGLHTLDRSENGVIFMILFKITIDFVKWQLLNLLFFNKKQYKALIEKSS